MLEASILNHLTDWRYPRFFSSLRIRRSPPSEEVCSPLKWRWTAFWPSRKLLFDVFFLWKMVLGMNLKTIRYAFLGNQDHRFEDIFGWHLMANTCFFEKKIG